MATRVGIAGPPLIFVSPTPPLGSTNYSWSLLGFTERAPSILYRLNWHPVHNSLSGELPYTYVYNGANAFISLDMNVYDSDYLTIFINSYLSPYRTFPKLLGGGSSVAPLLTVNIFFPYMTANNIYAGFNSDYFAYPLPVQVTFWSCKIIKFGLYNLSSYPSNLQLLLQARRKSSELHPSVTSPLAINTFDLCAISPVTMPVTSNSCWQVEVL